MSGRGWRRWKSGGLYVSNGRKYAHKKYPRTHSEEYLDGCGRLPLISDGRAAKGSSGRKKSKNELGYTKSIIALNDIRAGMADDENSSDDDDSIPWIDQRSRLPPSLGWYDTPGKGTKFPFHKRFERSYEEKKREKSLERSFEEIFSKKSLEKLSDPPPKRVERAVSTESIDEHESLVPYDDVTIDIGSDEEFWTDKPRTPFPSSASVDAFEDITRYKKFEPNRERNQLKTTGHKRESKSSIKHLVDSKSSTSSWEHHVWTSKDLRRYLVLKASQRLGGPTNHLTCPEAILRDSKLKKKSARKRYEFSPNTSTGCSTIRSASFSSPAVNFSCASETALRYASLPREFIAFRGGTFVHRAASFNFCTPNSPPPRQRLFSLPSIIITHSEEQCHYRASSSSSPPSTPSSTSSTTMQFLQVPHTRPLRRAKSLDDTTEEHSLTKDRSSKSLKREMKRDNKNTLSVDTPGSPGMRISRIGSILNLMGDLGEYSDDDDSDRSESRSPPPDKRHALGDLLEYEESFMYGRYSANLADYARQEARRVREEERVTDEMLFSKELHPYRGRCSRILVKSIRPIWDHTFARLGEDWVFLFFLGISMASLSFIIDFIVFYVFKARMYLHNDLLNDIHWTMQGFSWVTIPCLLVIFSAAFCQWLAPSAAGSGIPEMKTILRGVILKEYLTFKTLIAKIVGLTTVLGAGLPLGKEGPVMHMASIVSTMLMNLLRAIKGVTDNEAHSTDLLAAACTMGVATCYAAPVGGVLFSIEVTAVYFAVRNYWRGFFGSVVGALFYRLMSVWFLDEETIFPIYKVDHFLDFPYDVLELLPFLCIGIFCGFVGSLYVYLHRRYVIFFRQNKVIKKLLNKRRLLYPTFVSILISLSTFPPILGQFMASTITTKQQILDLFSNVTWTVLPGQERTFEQSKILENWVPTYLNSNFYISLAIFQIVTLVEIGIASTLPVPNGILVPLLRVGAAFGRMIGELMVTLYPLGIRYGYPINPGAYAMVGAAAFCASITHTISISVIVFELTGQITYVIPIMTAVLISNCISSLLQPSIYDSVIRIKKLPYLPDIITTTSDVYSIYVDDIMVRDVKYIWYGISYMDLKCVIKENRKLKFFPIVDKHDSMILLGSIPRIELVRLLVEQICSEKRRKEAKKMYLEALKKRWEDEDLQNGPTESRIQYEDDLNSSDEEEEEDISTKQILKKLSKSLTRSLSRSSRSLTKSLSRSALNLAHSASRHHSPEGDHDSESEEAEDNHEESVEENESQSDSEEEEDHKDESVESDSESSTPPASPAVSKLKELFPVKSEFERRGSRFSVSKVKVGSAATNESTAEASDSKATEDADNKEEKHEGSSEESSDATASPSNTIDSSTGDLLDLSEGKKKTRVKKKSRLEILKGNKQKKEAKRRAQSTGEKPKVRLTRSNSLDSLHHKTKRNKDTTASTTDVSKEAEDSTPKKGILKRRNSLSLGSLNTVGVNGEETSYQTVTVVDTKLRNAFEKVRRMKENTAHSMEFKLSQLSLFKSKKKESPKKKEFDMTPEEREVWELRELSMEVDFTKCHIDPAPFQLVERTSLLRVHSLFSMLGINHAYVTAIGRLIGVVALKEVRAAIEGQYVGKNSQSNQSLRGKTSPQTPQLARFAPATSPQQMGATNPVPFSDPEAGTVFRRSVSSSQLYINGFGTK